MPGQPKTPDVKICDVGPISDPSQCLELCNGGLGETRDQISCHVANSLLDRTGVCSCLLGLFRIMERMVHGLFSSLFVSLCVFTFHM